jgi:cytochrome b involved in lipid metabolism
MSKTFSAADVASHNKPEDLFIIVDDDVYDLSKFQDDHPGKQSKLARADTND